MEDHDCDPNAVREPSVNFIGPFRTRSVVVHGWSVPFLHAHVNEDTGAVMLVLDDRFALDLTALEAERIVPFIADAIAVATGYSCHPRGDELPPHTPHGTPRRVIGIASMS